MNWYIGQEIVCVKTHSQGVVVRGKTYFIQGLKVSHCPCKFVAIDIGFDSFGYDGFCKCLNCGSKDTVRSNKFWLSEELFAPLDQDISELTEILEKENVVKI